MSDQNVIYDMSVDMLIVIPYIVCNVKKIFDE